MSSKVLLSIFSFMVTLPAITNALEAPVQSTEESSINALSEDASIQTENAAGAAELSVIREQETGGASEFQRIEESVVDYGPVMVDLEGTQVSLQEEEILRHPLVGSVILSSCN